MNAYSLKIEAKGDILFAQVSGKITSVTDERIDQDLRRACDEMNCHLLLIDIRSAVSRLTVLENHFAAATFRERMGSKIRAIAIIDDRDFLSNSEMFEITASNLGANVRFFDEIEPAHAWLLRYQG